MVYALTWLPDVLLKAGLKVAEVPDWRTRGRAEMGRVRGVMVHHTAGSPRGNMPTLDLLVKGRPDLSGPLAQLGLGRDGTYYVIAAGKCNHAGPGRWRGIDSGNSSFIGIEAENTGKPEDVWPAVQLDALRRGVAAILAHVGTDATMACGHREYALPAGRKNDPLFSMSEFREQVAGIMVKGVLPAPQIPARDAQSRPTLRRGAEGPLVKALQAGLGVETLGIFGPKTEAAVRELQRQHALVPDGIVGPKTWALVDALARGTATSPLTTSALTPSTPTAATTTAPAALPPPDDAAHPVRVEGASALAPDGSVFARHVKLGWMTIGQTSVRGALREDPHAGDGITPSRLAVVSAVSGNEGRLEAINSWDAAFLSFGILQWTLGVGDDPGELAALLARVRHDDDAAFAECFGRYRLDVAAAQGATTGHVVLAGNKVASAAAKAAFRTPEWAYRFWRAGRHPSVRRSQIAHAAARIDRFAGLVVSGHPLSAWLSSELGMALLLDQHVNRPGHVPATIRKAIEALVADGTLAPDPTGWDEAAEHALIDAYLDLRDDTSMTGSRKRANLLFDAAQKGALRSARGSFS